MYLCMYFVIRYGMYVCNVVYVCTYDLVRYVCMYVVLCVYDMRATCACGL